MSTSRFLFIILVIVAGYIFISNFTYTKSKIARSNGQQLYLKSAIWGLLFFTIAYFVKDPLGNSLLYSDILNLVPDTFRQEFDSLTKLGFLSVGISLLFLIVLQLPVFTFKSFIESTSLDTLLQKRFKNKFLNFLIKIVEAAWLVVQFLIWKYVLWLEKNSLAGNPIDALLFDSMLDENGVVMTCDDSGKVFIGFVLELPDPSRQPDERAFTLVPLMSGALCKEFQQLHITTDYSDTFSFYHESLSSKKTKDAPSNVAVVIYTKKIRIIRKFNINMFESFFKKKACACGYDIYLPKPKSQEIQIATSSKNN